MGRFAHVSRRVRRASEIVLAALALGAILAAAQSRDGPAKDPASVPETRSANAAHRVGKPFFRIVYGYGGTRLTPAQEGARYGIMILRQTDASIVPKLRAGNPHLRLFMVINMMSTDPIDPTGISDWVGYTDADAHPDWFLKDADGNRLTFKDYPTALVMDVANPAYQDAGLANVVNQVKAAGFDGVFLDDANASLRWVLPGGSAECVKYPTDAVWQSAAFSFLDRMAPKLRQAGLLVAANIGGSTVAPGLWQKWNAPLDGAMEESFTNGGAGRDSIANGQWVAKLRHARWSETHQKIAFDHAVTSTRSGARYGLGTMLLVANGENRFYASADYEHELWWPEYRTARRLGRPTGRYRATRKGVYRREFTHGVVVVNPQTHAVRRIRLGGRYSGSGLRNVERVKLRPTSAVVLVRS
jgi:hypothetical protein